MTRGSAGHDGRAVVMREWIQRYLCNPNEACAYLLAITKRAGQCFISATSPAVDLDDLVDDAILRMLESDARLLRAALPDLAVFSVGWAVLRDGCKNTREREDRRRALRDVTPQERVCRTSQADLLVDAEIVERALRTVSPRDRDFLLAVSDAGSPAAAARRLGVTRAGATRRFNALIDQMRHAAS